MDEVDRYRYQTLLIWRLIIQENVYYQSRQRLLDPQIYAGWDHDMRIFANEQNLAKFWPELE